MYWPPTYWAVVITCISLVIYIQALAVVLFDYTSLNTFLNEFNS